MLYNTSSLIFLSTLSLRRATAAFSQVVSAKLYFYPRSPCGERLVMVGLLMCNLYFYPRSPCGERLQWEGMRSLSEVISIHALLAESDKDTLTDDVSTGGFLSTLSLRRATVYPGTWSGSILISIHALLAESDLRVIVSSILQTNFYPRSPCGERLAKLYYFACPFLFLSTLSLRRATTTLNNIFELFPISIHALLAESDIPNSGTFRSTHNFYPRSPCGERL